MSLTHDEQLLPGFERRRVEVDDGVPIDARVGGAGPPLLLLHGHPQTRAIWHKVAPALARGVNGQRSAGLAPFAPTALAEYERCLALPDAAHGLCED